MATPLDFVPRGLPAGLPLTPLVKGLPRCLATELSGIDVSKFAARDFEIFDGEMS
jgi:hypothetical protein